MRNKQKILSWLTERDENKLFRFIVKRYELLSYIFFGMLTTLVNVTIFTFLENILGQDKWYLSNFPAIILAILFAYLTNRSFVFDSDGNFWVEMVKFFGARILVSLTFEYGASWLLYNVLGFDTKLNLVFFEISWFKIISMALVLVANYIASKLFIFKTTVEVDPRKNLSEL